jgi:hypothetical protein
MELWSSKLRTYVDVNYSASTMTYTRNGPVDGAYASIEAVANGYIVRHGAATEVYTSIYDAESAVRSHIWQEETVTEAFNPDYFGKAELDKLNPPAAEGDKPF